jgi:hypothetical protein
MSLYFILIIQLIKLVKFNEKMQWKNYKKKLVILL